MAKAATATAAPEQQDAVQPLVGNLLTVSILDPGLKTKSAEVAYAIAALGTMITELGRGRGNTSSGVILGTSSAGVANTANGAWTYTPTATLP